MALHRIAELKDRASQLLSHDIERRLEDKADEQFLGAYAELYVLATIPSWTRTRVIPTLGRAGSRPECQVALADGHLDVEVKLFRDGFERIKRSRAEDILHDAWQRVRTTGFGVGHMGHVQGDRDPSPRRIASRIDTWLRTLDYDDLVQRATDGEPEFPETLIEDESGWAFHLTAAPLKQPDITVPRLRSFITGPSLIKWSHQIILKEVKEALNQHKTSTRLIVVLVGTSSARPPSDNDVWRALYGSMDLIAGPKGSRTEWSGNGLWNASADASRLEAVAVITGVAPWRAHPSAMRIYMSPRVDQCPLDTWPGEIVRCDGAGNIRVEPGPSPA